MRIISNDQVHSRLSEMIAENLSMEDILQLIVNERGISEEEIRGPKRDGDIVFARHLFCYLTNLLIKRGDSFPSLQAMGSVIDKDHASVLHAIKSIRNRIETNTTIKFIVNDLQEKCEMKAHKTGIGACVFIKDHYSVYSKLAPNKELDILALFENTDSLTIPPESSVILSTGFSLELPAGLSLSIMIGGIKTTFTGKNKEITPRFMYINDSDKAITITQKEKIGSMSFYSKSSLLPIKVKLINAEQVL